MALGGLRDPAYGAFAWTVFDFASKRMRRRDGSFVFQRRRRWANTAPHIRWMAAPMLEALTRLQRASEGTP